MVTRKNLPVNFNASDLYAQVSMSCNSILW